jgi:hypothetical protein
LRGRRSVSHWSRRRGLLSRRRYLLGRLTWARCRRWLCRMVRDRSNGSWSDRSRGLTLSCRRLCSRWRLRRRSKRRSRGLHLGRRRRRSEIGSGVWCLLLSRRRLHPLLLRSLRLRVWGWSGCNALMCRWAGVIWSHRWALPESLCTRHGRLERFRQCLF